MFEPCVNRKQQTEKLKSFVFVMETMTMFDLLLKDDWGKNSIRLSKSDNDKNASYTILYLHTQTN